MATTAHVQLKLTLRHYEILQQAMRLACEQAEEQIADTKDCMLGVDREIDPAQYQELDNALTEQHQLLASLEMLKSTLRG